MFIKLSWSHYCELLSVTDNDKWSFCEKEILNSGWSVRDSSLYECLLLSNGTVSKEKVLSLSKNSIELAQPAGIIFDPYAFEFWYPVGQAPAGE